MDVIPAIDIRRGRCVRLLQGDYARETIFADDPVAVAERWASLGAQRIHVVDLDGAAAGGLQNGDLIRRLVAAAAPAQVQLGGGLRDLEAIELALSWGIDRAVLGTAAVTAPELVAEACRRHPDRVVVALDARDGSIAIRGWREDTGTPAAALAVQMEQAGAPRFLYTDIARDGTETEPHYQGLAALLRATSRPVIASGGVAQVAHLLRLRDLGVEGAIVGRALYTGAIDLFAALAAVAPPEAEPC